MGGESVNRLAVCLVILTGAPGCTNVIVAPAPPVEPEPVFLLDHGRHATLVLPGADSGIVRYGYGDWRYYAERQTGLVATLDAALVPTRAGLGRRAHPVPPTRAAVRDALDVGIEGIHELVAERRSVERLRTKLDELFELARETRLENRAYDLDFVHHPRDYTIFRNSNWMVGVWLRELGYAVRGPLLFSRWRVESAHRPNAPSSARLVNSSGAKSGAP